MTSNNTRMRPVVALNALKRLIADPEQTHEVFTVIRALSGPSFEDTFRKFQNTHVGQRILSEKIDLLDTLKDRVFLAGLPQGSLGAKYLHFVASENLSADGLVDASNESDNEYLDADRARFGARQRDTHDLWHTLTQYGRDELGEACLLAFTYAQTKNRGLGVICLVGCAKLSQQYGKGVFKAAWHAYQDGKRAAWLPAQDWESLLLQPINEVRQTLNLTLPERYQDLRGNLVIA